MLSRCAADNGPQNKQYRYVYIQIIFHYRTFGKLHVKSMIEYVSAIRIADVSHKQIASNQSYYLTGALHSVRVNECM